MTPIYLDFAATTPMRPEVREAMLPFLSDRFGNPASLHRWGREARAALEEARARLAAVIGASRGEVVFVHGGTEADNVAVLGRTRLAHSAPVVVSRIEHKAVLAAARTAEQEGSPLHLLPVDVEGAVLEEELEPLLSGRPAVVSVMWANNEVGVVQPVARIAARCAEAEIAFHSDAVQALGKIPVRVDEIPVSLLSLSAHKIGGPKGVGALFVRRGTALQPVLHGGGQERGLTSGTVDVAGAVGMAVAAELAEKERELEAARLGQLRDRLERAVRERISDVLINAGGAERVPNISNLSFPGADAEALLLSLDMEGVAVSSGSACSSGAVAPSHVLTAMGHGIETAGPSLRFSLGKTTTEKEIERVVAVLPPLIERLRSFSAAT